MIDRDFDASLVIQSHDATSLEGIRPIKNEPTLVFRRSKDPRIAPLKQPAYRRTEHVDTPL